MNRVFYIFLFTAISQAVFAQDKSAQPIGTGNLHLDLLLIAACVLALLVLWVAVVFLKTFRKLSQEILNPTPFVPEIHKQLEFDEWLAIEKAKPSIWIKLLSLKPLSEEENMKLEHEFDGIVELNNPIPAWFNWLFYTSIVIAIGYMFYYHVLDWGKLQDEEYLIEVRVAKVAKDAYLANTANLIDENTVKESSEAAVIAEGAAIYATNCVACHGDKGQGVVGPNLADEYWLHGGKVGSVFKTIKYGVPEKGMIAWEKTLSPKQISSVSNYIKSLKGTNPANPKAPQGDKEG
ncbi:MAG TPA: cbb3-type cytochrome c oxidase N-terminal domain-containing protein [Pedobacter sp.]|jgi:cytochrome c oxidase cbb3-type subunit 3